ncbi:MAG: sigma-70 family RNA polymerase sigma factor [Clostridia bacterium]
MESENRIFQLYRDTGDIEVRNEIVERYYYLAETLAKKFRNRGVEYDDLIQIGSLALIKAAERFDHGKGIKFITFATPTIIGEIKKYFRDKASSVRMPRKYYEAYPLVKNALDTLIHEQGQYPTADEIAGVTHLKAEEVLEILEMAKSGSILSLDEEYEEEGLTRMDSLSQTEMGFEQIENIEVYRMALDMLEEEEREIILMRLEKGFTQKKIAEVTGYSQMYISRLEKKIYRKLKGLIQTE